MSDRHLQRLKAGGSEGERGTAMTLSLYRCLDDTLLATSERIDGGAVV